MSFDDYVLASKRSLEMSLEQKTLIKISSMQKDMIELSDLLINLEADTKQMQKFLVHKKRLLMDPKNKLLQKLPLRIEHLEKDIKLKKNRISELCSRMDKLNNME